MDSSGELEWYKHTVGRQEDTALYPWWAKPTAHVQGLPWVPLPVCCHSSCLCGEWWQGLITAVISISYHLQTPNLPYFSESSKMPGHSKFYPSELHTFFPFAHILECSLGPLQLPIFSLGLTFFRKLLCLLERSSGAIAAGIWKGYFGPLVYIICMFPCHVLVFLRSIFVRTARVIMKLLEKWGRSGFFTEVTLKIFLLWLFILTISCLLSNLPLDISNAEVN